MTTARYIVALTHHQDTSMRVEKSKRFSEDDRAVLYARKWLREIQFHKRYFGITFSQYEVYKQRESGAWFCFEIGDVERAEASGPNNESGRTARHSRKKSATTLQQDATQSAVSDPVGRIPKVRQRTAKSPGSYGKRTPTLSPLAQRIREIQAEARAQMNTQRLGGEAK